jgi:antitoxin FitA
MWTMTIDDLDDELMAALRVRAAQHGQSIEDEAKDIVAQALTDPAT